MPSLSLSTASDFAALVSATRAQRAASATPRPFRANAGGPFLAPRSFDAGTPSTRALDAAADSVARSKRDADAVRASYARAQQHARDLNGGRFSTPYADRATR